MATRTGVVPSENDARVLVRLFCVLPPCRAPGRDADQMQLLRKTIHTVLGLDEHDGPPPRARSDMCDNGSLVVVVDEKQVMLHGRDGRNRGGAVECDAGLRR